MRLVFRAIWMVPVFMNNTVRRRFVYWKLCTLLISPSQNYLFCLLSWLTPTGGFSFSLSHGISFDLNFPELLNFLSEVFFTQGTRHQSKNASDIFQLVLWNFTFKGPPGLFWDDLSRDCSWLEIMPKLFQEASAIQLPLMFQSTACRTYPAF